MPVELALWSGADSLVLLTEDRSTFFTLRWVTISSTAFSISEVVKSLVMVALLMTPGKHSGSSAGIVSKMVLMFVVGMEVSFVLLLVVVVLMVVMVMLLMVLLVVVVVELEVSFVLVVVVVSLMVVIIVLLVVLLLLVVEIMAVLMFSSSEAVVVAAVVEADSSHNGLVWSTVR